MKFLIGIHMLYAFTATGDILILLQAGKGGELTHDETTIISGALDLTEKVLGDINSTLLAFCMIGFVSYQCCLGEVGVFVIVYPIFHIYD